MGMDSYTDISFTIGHLGYNECVKTQAYVLQGCISFMNKYHQMKDEK